jgi:prepilin-type N-terminal cleavage/methylation domain-containing protein
MFADIRKNSETDLSGTKSPSTAWLASIHCFDSRFGSSSQNFRVKKGFSLIEVMVAVLLTCIIALGTLGYRYLSVKHGRTADAQLMAVRIGQLLLEDWKSQAGNADYDPESLNLGFAAPKSGEYGAYFITLGNIPFFVDLQNTDVETDAAAGVTLRQMAVIVKWRSDLTRGAIRSYDPSLTFTTYVRRDQD